MLKLRFLMAAIIISVFFVPNLYAASKQKKQEWVYVAKAKDGSTVYYSPKSFKKLDMAFCYSVRMKITQKNEDPKIFTSYVDFIKKEYVTTEVEFLDEGKQKILVISEPEVMQINEGSALEYVSWLFLEHVRNQLQKKDPELLKTYYYAAYERMKRVNPEMLDIILPKKDDDPPKPKQNRMTF